MSGMRYLPLGVGDAFSARYYTCCVALEAEGRWLLIDCPHPIRKLLKEGSERAGVELDIAQVEAVALTHLHADHASGLEGFAFFHHFALGRRARLVLHPDVQERLWKNKLSASMEMFADETDLKKLETRRFEDYFEAHPVTEAKPYTLGPFTIECRKTIHPIPTTAFRIHAGGKVLGHSADTCFDPELLAWLSEADLVIHETNHGIHTPLEKLLEIEEPLRSKLRLIHYPDSFDPKSCPLEALEQGRLYEL